MANYNPHAPHIIGQEWVPIRQADYPPDDNVTERGYTFRIEHAVVPVTGAYYIAQTPANRLSQVCDFMAVYPAGQETLTGPIKKLYVPASAVAVTGPSIDISGGVAALLNPNDNNLIIFGAPGNGNDLQVNFNTEAYSQQLFGKRILDVSVRYVFMGDPLEGQNIQLDVTQPDGVGETVRYAASLAVATTTSNFNIVKPQYSSVSLTDLNPFWDTSVAVNQQRNILPWRFQELNLFRSGAAVNDRLLVSVNNSTVESSVFLSFMDLEVTYCEETRVRYGGRRTGNQLAPSGLYITDDYSIGQNIVRLYNTSFVNTASLAAGDYTVTLKHVNLNPFTALDGEPTIRAVRPYYDFATLAPVRVRTTLTEDEEFTREAETVLTHLTVHTASTIVTGSHAYGTTQGAPVYGSITATQEIEDDPVGTARTYPQVRFYARRFGNTTVPLTLVDVATGTHTVSITPAEFDALEEIVDGWREVTLRFATAPTFSTAAGDVDWRWTATGELAGNQWQILAADGPSTSVTTPSSLATALATGRATYYAPQGDTVALTWKSPTVSGAAEDPSTDAVLIFSQDPVIVTGFTVTVAEQELEVVDLECGTPPGCLPTGISYMHMNWDLNVGCDTFDRPADTTWNTATTGQVWSTTGTGFSTNGTRGLMSIPTGDLSVRTAVMPLTIPNPVIRTTVSVSQMATGAAIDARIRFRYTSDNDLYQLGVSFATDGTVDLALFRVVGGVALSIGTANNVTTYYPNRDINVLIRVVGSQLQAKVWAADTLIEPQLWNIDITDTSLTTGQVVLRGLLGAGNTNVNPVISWDNFSAYSVELDEAYLEIDRYDAIDAEWRTIMRSSGVCASEFDDYEARVGIESQYRIRVLNVLDFAGAWVTGSGTIPTPGVAVADDANSILIFTSNADPDASLAYVMQWETTPIEEFIFPEASDVIMQELYGRDYAVAFRPLERGGEQFTRTILVSAAALTPSRLANFDDLRDLAWAELDYVCVRDELGNRWFATVIVPSGDVRGNRTAYLAKITVRLVTDTPTPIDSTA